MHGKKRWRENIKTYKNTNDNDPWLKLMGQKATIPDLYEWRHRTRVMELMMSDAHPLREHIRRVLASEEQRAHDDARALLRSQELTGAAASLDIAWPPNNDVRLVIGKPSRELLGMEFTEEETTTEEEETWSPPPPPGCGPRFRERKDGEGDGNGGGRGMGFEACAC